MTEHAGEPAPPDTTPESPPPARPEPGSGPDALADDTGEPAEGDDEAAGQRAEEEDDRIQSAAELGVSASTRRRLRQAGQESLGGTWFEDAVRFTGPATFGGGHAIGGNVSRAGRDVNYIFGGVAARRTGTDAGPIAPALLAKIRATHVPGGSYAAADKALRATRIVILRGTSGSGKRTSALRLLTELARDNVHEIGVSTALEPPSGDADLQAGTGYLAEGDAGSGFAYHRMVAWTAKLSELNAYLIVTVPATAAIGADVAEHFLIDHIPPSAHAIVRSHLRADQVHGARAELLLDKHGVLSCATSPAAAADLAARLLATVRDTLPETILAPLVRDLRGSEARRMLGAGRPTGRRERVDLLCRRAAMISIAVFTRLPYTEAMAAAETLAAAFISIEFPPRGSVGRELFTRWPDLLQAEPGIRIVESELPSQWGEIAVRHIRFSDPQLHGVMLEEIWERYDTVRSPLLEWLGDLALRAQDEAVRIRAAQVVGRFAIRDFGHVCHRLIAGWANSVNERHRETAATALEAAATGRRTHVWKLLEEWCDGGSQHRQRTAILALGTAIGDQNPDDTLNRLRQLAIGGTGGPGRSVAEAVRRSLIDLMSGPHQGTVVRALRQWADGKDIRLPSLARRCVPPLAHLTDGGDRSSFLATLSGEPTLRPDAVSLFAAALADPETSQETWLALEQMAVTAARESWQLDALGELFHGLRLSPEADTSRLTFYLRVWARRHDELTAVISGADACASA